MSYMYCLGICVCCKMQFSFNPSKVPSFRVDGVRQPVCKHCVVKVNPKRVANNLEPIVPLDGAYEPEEVH